MAGAEGKMLTTGENRLRLPRLPETIVKPDRDFLCYDGEAVGGRYVLLANSRHYLAHPDHSQLTTDECLRFLAKREDGNPIRCWFGGEYDVTMILRDWPIATLRTLAEEGVVEHGGWIVRHIPRRLFQVQGTFSPPRVYFDVWSYFACSLLEADDAWQAEDAEGRALLEWGKAARHDFQDGDWEKIVEYNHEECLVTEQLMGWVRRSASRAGLHPGRWYGPGTLAECTLRGVELLGDYRYPTLARHAQFGGRVELFQRGVIPGPVYNYDLHSAYGAALATIPDCGEWRQTRDYQPGLFGIWQCEWSCDDGAIIGPFPHRRSGGDVQFPPAGRGFYHAAEVDAAIRLGYPVKIRWGYVAEPLRNGPLRQPVLDLYRIRQRWQRSGDPGESVIKAAIAAIYGKLAQVSGRQTYYRPLLAGYITAWTRARILEAVSQQPEAIVQVTTDGVLSRLPLRLRTGSGMGQWSETVYDRVDAYLPGIYRAVHAGEMEERHRGYLDLDLDTLASRIRGNPGGARTRQRSFVTYRMGVHTTEYEDRIGEWVEREAVLDPNAGNKRLWWTETAQGYAPAPLWTEGPQSSFARPLARPERFSRPLGEICIPEPAQQELLFADAAED